MTFGKILCGLGACNISAFGRESVVALLIRASLFGMLVVVVVDHAVDENVVVVCYAKKKPGALDICFCAMYLLCYAFSNHILGPGCVDWVFMYKRCIC